MDRFAFLIPLAHNARALFVYDSAWLLLLAAAVPYGLRLRRAAREIDRRIRWERDTSV